MFNKKYSKLLPYRGTAQVLCFCVFVFLCSGVLSANFCLAEDRTTILENTSGQTCTCNTTQISAACKQYCGDYGLNDFVQIVINVSIIVLGIVGSLALLMFIYGGIMFLISSGNSEKVTQAKQIIIGAVIGLVIVFASYTIIQFVFDALGIPNTNAGKWAVTSWFE